MPVRVSSGYFAPSEYDYIFGVDRAGQKFYSSGLDGWRRGTDNLDILADTVIDENGELSAMIRAGDWGLTKKLHLIGDINSDTIQPRIIGQGRYRTKISPTNINAFHLTKGVAAEIAHLQIDLPTAASKEAILADNLANGDVSPTSYEETGLYHGSIHDILVTGGANKGDNSEFCIKLINGEFYHLHDIDCHPSGDNLGGLLLEQQDMNAGWSVHDAHISGKNLISVEGSGNPICLAIRRKAGETDPVNLLKTVGATWLRHDTGGGTGIDLDAAVNMDLGMFHLENLDIGVDIDAACEDLAIHGGMSYNYTTAGGTMLKTLAGSVNIRFQKWYMAVSTGKVVINNAGGSRDAPIELDVSLEGTSEPTWTNTGYLKVDKHRTHGSIEPYGVR